MTLKISRLVLISSSFLSLSSAVAYTANTKCVSAKNCKSEIVGKRLDDSTTENVPVGANTENTIAPKANAPMFSISVDGEHVAGTKIPKDKQRKTDLALEAVDIQVKFDGLDVKPVLNVSTYPPRQIYKAGEKIDFLASNNYPAWIAKSEIRIFRAGDAGSADPLFVLPTSKLGTARWRMPQNLTNTFSYVLRVTDSEGRFDETRPLPLTRTSRTMASQATGSESVAPGYGDDRTAIRNIPVYGGAVTVFGRNVPQGHTVTALGEVIPIDNESAFVVQRILPPGDHNVDVAVMPEIDHGKGFEFNRSINIPENDWFYVGQVDATLGHRFGSPHTEAALPGEFKKTYTKGRVAFYLKGKIKGRYLLTAAADTGEDKIENLFTGLDAKDPKQFLRRINPDDYYPVYGDDSTSIEDAPTRGKFFVRLAKGDSHVQWGNFKTEIKGTELLRNERALYGASGVYKSDTTTTFGERLTQGTAYAAQPGTLPQRDELRGTGGSAYFLSHRDVTIGSETVSIETRDRITGNVISRTALVNGKDFDFDYFQGLIILRTVLNSTSSNGAVVGVSGLGNYDNYLVSAYEYTPALGKVSGYSYGGRAQQWLGDRVRFGVTGQSEKTGRANQNLYGVDIEVRKSDRTYIDAEVARSRGPGFGLAASTDGGLTISNSPTAGTEHLTADALRLHGHIGVDEIIDLGTKGDIDGFYEHVQAGFSSLGKQVTSTETNYGISAKVDLSETSHADATLTRHQSKDGHENVNANAQVSFSLGENWTITPGANYSDKQKPTGIDTGARTDVGARLKYAFDENTFVYVFGQGTVERSGTRRNNHRAGVGVGTLLTEKVGLTAEASDGTSGLGGSAMLDYKPTADDHYYFGYTLDPERDYSGDSPTAFSGTDMGTFVAGANHAYDKRLSVFVEDHSDLFGDRRSLTQTYGVKYTPDELWTFGLGFEIGNIWDNTINATTLLKNSDFDRKAASATVAYHASDDVSAHAKLEYRNETSEDHTRDMKSYLMQAGASVKTSDDWRFSKNLSVVISDASDTTRSGKYVEAWLGYAYRPIANDRLNALFKYTFLFDRPGADQVNASGTTNGPSQISNIMTADVSYDLNEIFNIGGKYGFRIGDTLDRTAGSTWQHGSAHLGVVRLDMHIVKNWDALVEARMLWTPESRTEDFGVLAAAYRHLGDNFKVGVGYNFGHFSDDLSKIGVDDHGVFINAIGKF